MRQEKTRSRAFALAAVVAATSALAQGASAIPMRPTAAPGAAARSPFEPQLPAKGQRALPAKARAKAAARPAPHATASKAAQLAAPSRAPHSQAPAASYLQAPAPKAVAPTPAFPGEGDEEAVEPPRAVAASPAGSAVALAAGPGREAARPTRATGPRGGRLGRLPTAFLNARVDRLWAEIKARPSRAPLPAAATSIYAEANKQNWLKEAYARNLVDASFESFMLADKLILGEILKRELGSGADRFYPKTLGLKQFLEKRGLVGADGQLRADPDAVEQALADEFPFGFVVRPAVGVAPSETERGLFARSDQLVAELFAPQSAIYSPSSFRAPIRSHILGGVASGEAVILQEDVLLRADARKRLKARKMAIVRAHTYEGRVVPGAMPERWVQDEPVSEEQQRRADAFVGEMLGRLSAQLLARQAWSVDVATMDNGELRVVDVVTNRGHRSAWSGYLDQPRVLGAYSRLWEERCGIAFGGVAGAVLRHNMANYFPYWGKRVDSAKTAWKKILALLPPLP